MARQVAWLLVAAVLCAPAAGAGMTPRSDQHEGSSRQGERRTKWWTDPERRAELGITDAQSAEIDAIFTSTVPKLRASWREVEKLEADLSKMIKENTADVATVARQVEKYEQARAEHNTIRTVMLYRMHRVLSAEQREKLEAMRARRDQDRRRQSDKP